MQGTVQSDRKAVNGSSPRSVDVASSGLRTSQDFKDLGAAIAEDVLSGDLSHKIAGPVVRSILMTVRVAEYEQRHSNGNSVDLADSRRPRPDREAEMLAKREEELTRELEAVRELRAAK